MATPDFLIIGGGVIGMMTSLQLADSGYSIGLIERGYCGREASWAGGGVISPLYPWRQPDALSQLALLSRQRYPALAAELFETTGIDPEYHEHGLLYLDSAYDLAAHAWAQRFGQAATAVDGGFVARRAPALADSDRGALWMPTLGSIRNPRLCEALRSRIARHARIDLHEDTYVERLVLCADDRIAAHAAGGVFKGERTILATGAWTQTILAGLGVDLPVTPVKGQMLRLRARGNQGRRILDCVVLHDGHYLIPRADGSILVGSTLEPAAGFDKQPTDAARGLLQNVAVAIAPAFADWDIAQHWGGLRPGAPDGLPFIGALPGLSRLFVNAGHYRNGLVLAPAATRLLVDQLLGRPTQVNPHIFDPTERGVIAP